MSKCIVSSHCDNFLLQKERKTQIIGNMENSLKTTSILYVCCIHNKITQTEINVDFLMIFHLPEVSVLIPSNKNILLALWIENQSHDLTGD